MWIKNSRPYTTNGTPRRSMHLLVSTSEDSLDKSIQKITLSTQLAQEAKTSKVSLPEWCKDFEDVFSEKTYDVLPPHHPYDHTIDLKPSFVPKIAKVYPLNPKEKGKEACQAFVEEHLKTGHILPSKSPQAALFFFVPKKRWLSLPLSGLLISKFPYSSERLPPTTYS